MNQVVRVALGMGLTPQDVAGMTEGQLLAFTMPTISFIRNATGPVVAYGPDGKRLSLPWLDELTRGR